MVELSIGFEKRLVSWVEPPRKKPSPGVSRCQTLPVFLSASIYLSILGLHPPLCAADCYPSLSFALTLLLCLSLLFPLPPAISLFIMPSLSLLLAHCRCTGWFSLNLLLTCISLTPIIVCKTCNAIKIVESSVILKDRVEKRVTCFLIKTIITTIIIPSRITTERDRSYSITVSLNWNNSISHECQMQTRQMLEMSGSPCISYS